MTKPILNLVIPVFNQWDYTRACLQSLADSGLPEGCRLSLVDNASSDQTPELAQRFGAALFAGSFAYSRSESNLGFARACNLGAFSCPSEYVLFLNNDTLARPGWLEPLLELAQSEPLFGAASPMLFYPGNQGVQHIGIAFGPDLSPEHLFERFPETHPAVRGRDGLQAISGAALLAPHNLFLNLGGFHPEYINGFEDLELCWRIRQAGRTLHVCGQSRITHFAGQTPGRFDHDAHNANLLSARCLGAFKPDLHAFAAKQGYEIALTSSLETYLRPAAERMAKLDSLVPALNAPDELLSALNAEPLWHPGRLKLLTRLEAERDYAKALEQALLLVHFQPELANLRLLIRLAKLAKAPGILSQAAAKLERVMSLLANAPGLKARAQALASQLKDYPELAALYQALA